MKQRKDSQVFILKGYAGTGKTTLIRSIADYLSTQSLHIQLMAPTGQASVCTEERSQYLNKQKALVRLQQMVQSENQQKQAVTRNENWGKHTSLERGNARAKFEGRYFKRVA